MNICKICGKEIETKTSHSFRMETCFECQKKELHDIYLAYPVEKYIGQPFFADGEFYRNIEEFYTFCKNKKLNPSNMEIIKAELVQFPELDINNFFHDCLFEDDDVPDILREAGEKFNAIIREYNKTQKSYYIGACVRIELSKSLTTEDTKFNMDAEYAGL